MKSPQEQRSVEMCSAVATPFNGNSSFAHPQWGCQSHSVQFYSKDSFLLDRLIEFLRPAIRSGKSVLLIPAASHRDSIFSRLRSCGTEFALAVAQERFLLLDAEETLARFMVNGRPDPARFASVLGSRMVGLSAAAAGPQRQVAAFGEMVACLMKRGQRDAAVALEQLWNQLATRHGFQFLCAYPMHLFSSQDDRESLLKICAEHSHILPPERQAARSTARDGIESVISERQKAQAMEAEIRERRKLQEHDLRPKSVARNTAGSIPHQLSGPLEAIINTVYLARQQPELPEKTRRYLAIADRELERVCRVVQRAVEIDRDSSQSIPELDSGDPGNGPRSIR